MTFAVHGVSVRVGTATLLADATLELRPGEVLAVAGPNGAGKSTLLRTLAGDVRPAVGEVRLGDRPLTAWTVGERARRRAVMLAEAAVAFAFTVEEVVLLGRMPFHGGNPGRDDRSVATTLLAAVDCSHLAKRVFETLSGGERQRVRLARALAQVLPAPATPDRDQAPERFVLLDEPTADLDPAHQHMAMRLLRDQAASGLGVLAVLHDLNLVSAYADRVAFLKDRGSSRWVPRRP